MGPHWILKSCVQDVDEAQPFSLNLRALTEILHEVFMAGNTKRPVKVDDHRIILKNQVFSTFNQVENKKPG